MLLIMQYPLCDIRSLLDRTGGRLEVPKWLEHEPDSNAFIRNFGQFGPRQAGGVIGLFGENSACDCNRAIRFTSPVRYSDRQQRNKHTLWVWFRRLYFDGFTTGRFEIGLITDPKWRKKRVVAGVEYDLSDLLTSLHQVSVNLHGDDLKPMSVPLMQAQSSLEDVFITATTKHRERTHFPLYEMKAFAVRVGSPLLYLRCSGTDQIGLGQTARQVSLQPTQGTQLNYIISAAADKVPVWMQQSATNEYSSEGRAERDLRVLLSRFNAEQHAMAHIQSVVDDGRLKVKLKGTQGRLFDQFLERSILRLEDLQSQKTAKTAASQAATIATAAASAGKDADLLLQLQELAEHRAKAKDRKSLLEYAGEFGKFIVEAAAKVGIEALVKSQVGLA